MDQKVRRLKRAQKESLIRKEFCKLFLAIKLDDSSFEDIYINRVQLSPDKGMVRVFFFTHKGQDFFQEKLKDLILYKPSIRKALSQILNSRYTPEIVFKYDKTFEKQCKIEKLLDQVKSLQDDDLTEENTQDLSDKIPLIKTDNRK